MYLDTGTLVSLTAQTAVDWMNTKVAPLFQEFSYGKTTLTATATSKVYRLPQTAAAYATADYSVLHQAAQAVAAADYVLANYDRLVVAFGSLVSLPGSNYQFAGLASRGGKEVWINGRFWCVGHELGHTFGLPHANLWQVTDLNPISDAGTSTSYGDPFDIMGGAVNYDGRAHFTPWGKNILGWLADTQVQTVTASGTYRVYRFDDATATGTLALKIARDSTRNIWIGLRRKFTDNAALSHGAYVLWGHPSGEAVNLLDLSTPGSDPGDAALAMGRSYVDPVANVTIKPVAEGGTTPGEYLDVQVTFGPAAPSLYVAPAPAATGSGLSAAFKISAAGVPAVVYRWQRLPAGATAWTNVTDGDTYTGGATNVLTVKSAAVAMTGDQFRCIVSNSVGQLISSPGVPLTVNATGVATVAGRVGVFLQKDGLGSGAAFMRPTALAYGADGTLYVTEQLGGVRKISPRGEVSTLAATLSSPNGLAVGDDGTVYVSKYDTHTISKVSPSGVASVWAGASGVAGSADGPVASARFNAPSGLALDAAGNLYVADFRNRTIRRISAAGDVTTLAGSAGQLGTVDGVGASARFSYAETLTVDPWGTLYVADGSRIRRIASDLQVTTLPDPDHRLSLPYGLSADPFGNLWVADWENSMVFRIKPDRSIVAVAGQARQTGSADGDGAAARFYHLDGLVRDAAGAIFVADADNYTIRRIVVPGLPQISTQPAAQVVGAGTTLTLTVAGADPAGYAYQWFKDGSAISGATSAVYSKPAAQLADGGLYSVAVANSEGSITSVPARVTVGLGVVSPPVAQSVYLGQPLTLSVDVASVGTPAYQWRNDGVDLPGATGASFSLAAAGTADGGNYSVAVSSAAGSLLSPAVAVTLKSPVVGWVPRPYPDFTTPPAGLGEVKAIAAGSEHCLALRKDGTVVTWGSSRSVLAVPAGLNNVVSIAASVYGPVSGAVKSDGSVVVWGDTLYYGLPTVPPGLSNVRSIAFGERTLLALKVDGSLVWWSYPNTALTVPAAAVNVVGIASGRYSGAALKSDGTVVTWGSFSVPPPAGLSGVVAVSAGGYFFVAMKSDGTVVAWGDTANTAGELNVPAGLNGVAAISSGYFHTLALKSDGSVIAWGMSTRPDYSPPAGTNWPLTAVAAGLNHNLGLVGAAPIVVAPAATQLVGLGAGATLSVAASGAGALAYQWWKNGAAIAGATGASLVLSNTQVADAGSYYAVVTSPSGRAPSAMMAVVPVGLAHDFSGAGYRAGGTLTLTNTLSFSGTLRQLRWSVLLPPGWSYAAGGGSEGDVKPVVGSTDLADWEWTSPPAGPFTFTYTLNVPADATGEQHLAALATLGSGTGSAYLLAKPDPLVILAAPSQHSADANRDARISLLELTRVIELYNTRSGTSRTGCYKVDAAGEDGFNQEPTRASTAVVTLASYHSADSDRNGKISLIELTRVIELYNYRSGTLRTGQYHALRAGETSLEDGFNSGP